MTPLDIFVGYDAREAVAYHVCVNSIIRHASVPVRITPLALNTLSSFYKETHVATNAFVHSRFLVPYLCGYRGTALFVDGDMIFKDDVAKLFALMRNDCDVAVVKHDYKTKYPTKYFGQPNKDYEKKNWSSVILWNCGNYPNACLTPEFIQENDSKFLHRFEWLNPSRVQELPIEWNWLVDEYRHNDDAKILHYTLALPAVTSYEDCDHAKEWWDELHLTMEIDETR